MFRIRMAPAVATIAACAAACTFTSSALASGPRNLPRTATATPTTAVRLFSPSSVWNAALSSTATLDPTSSARVSALQSEVQSEIQAGIGPWIATNSYSTPLYVVGPSQARVPVTLDGVGGWGYDLQSALNQGVPIPPGAQPAAGTDGHLTVYQPSTDTLWELWRATLKSDGWHASWGGAMQHVSQNPGYYSNQAWPGLSSTAGYNWGSTASSLPVIAGTITLADLQSGSINHALAVAVPDACQGTFTWPAQRTDGSSTDANCIPEGAHLRLDPNLNLASLNLPPITLKLALAAQRYGMIVRDVTHHAFQFYTEDPTQYGGDPYYSSGGYFGGLMPWNFLPQFPWAHLQLLKMNLCSGPPCAAPAGAVAVTTGSGTTSGTPTSGSTGASTPGSAGSGTSQTPSSGTGSTYLHPAPVTTRPGRRAAVDIAHQRLVRKRGRHAHRRHKRHRRRR